MKELDLKPGKVIKRLKEAELKWRIRNVHVVNQREECLRYLREILPALLHSDIWEIHKIEW